jgi:FlaG/FlaF family flagellin (archaellin)
MPASPATPADSESRRSPPWPVGRSEPTGLNVTDRAATAHTDADRAVSPVLAVVLLVGLTVCVAALVGTLVFDQAAALDGPAPRATFSIDAAGDRIRIVHERGDAVAVGPLHIEVAVDGEPLAHQPPVPFFAATGFESGPTGPFNPSSDGDWTAGERASFRIAGTNAPALEPGSELTVDLFHDETRIASLTTEVAG